MDSQALQAEEGLTCRVPYPPTPLTLPASWYKAVIAISAAAFITALVTQTDALMMSIGGVS